MNSSVIVENTTRSSRSTRLPPMGSQRSFPELYPLDTTVVNGGFLVTVTRAQASVAPSPGNTKLQGEEDPSSGIGGPPRQDMLPGGPSVNAVSPDLLLLSAHSMPVSAAKKAWFV